MSSFNLNTFLSLATIVGSLFVGLTLTIRHFRILRIVRELVSRIPLALQDDMIHGLSSPIQARATHRFSCFQVVNREEYNQRVSMLISRLQEATNYPLKSRSSIVAVVLWLLCATLAVSLYVGSAAVTPSQEDGNGAAPATATAGTEAASSNVAKGGAAVAEKASTASTRSVLSGRALLILIVVLALASFSAFFVVSFHYGVYYLLVEDVKTLCEEAGLAAIRKATGQSAIFAINEAANDPGFRALQRLTKSE